MKLAELQALFWEAIRHPTGIDDFLRDADVPTRERFEAAFVDTPGFSRRQRMTVYAESYFWRLSEVLGQQYRVTAWLAGPQRFHDLVTDFVWERPSTTRDVRRFGTGFAEYLAGHPLAEEIEGIEEFARVERSIVDALDHPDVAAVDAAALQARPIETWPTMRLVAAPWVRLWTTRRSFPEADDARREGAPSPDPIPAPDGRPHAVLIWRQGLEVYHRSVPAPEARALSAMLAGETFERLCSAAASGDGDAAGPDEVVAWLQRWLAGQLVVDVA